MPQSLNVMASISILVIDMRRREALSLHLVVVALLNTLVCKKGERRYGILSPWTILSIRLEGDDVEQQNVLVLSAASG